MASAREAFQRQRAREHGRGQQRLRQHVLHGFRAQEFEDDLERKGVLLAQRDHDAVVGGGGLQLEVEGAAEALAQRQSPGAVDARAERRVDDELHAAGFVEEALGDDACVGGQRAERGAARLHVLDGLFARRGGRGRTPSLQQFRRATSGTAISSRSRETSRDSSAVRPGASPRQNGIEGGAPWASSTRTRPGFHAPDAPRRGAQQEDIAGHAFDGEIFVERADRRCLRARRPPGSWRCREWRRRR